VNISLDKNDSVLLTQRLKKQDLIVYLSSLAGSILGVMGIVGFFMNLIEEKYEKYKKNRIVKRSLEWLHMNKRQLIEKNFLSLDGESKQIITSNLSNYSLELEEFIFPVENMTERSSNNGLSRRNSMVLVKV
jgi:hypothetical protein